LFWEKLPLWRGRHKPIPLAPASLLCVLRMADAAKKREKSLLPSVRIVVPRSLLRLPWRVGNRSFML
jgi:hypothetical protein